MEMEILSRETIKPSSPTPPHLRIHPLSFLDNITFRNYVPLVFFYHPNERRGEARPRDQTSKISKLRKSLSQVLSRYYPFAGMLRDQFTVECNDQGVSFLVTKIRGIELSTILHNPTETLLNPLFPDELQWSDVADWSTASLIATQINCFACGGMAISVCMSHKVGDASTLFNFINDWATINRKEAGGGGGGGGEFNLLPFPLLDGGASVFPQEGLPVFPETMFVKEDTVVCKRFVFQAPMIESLKSMVTSHEVKNPTRVQVVTAWIYKRAVSALGLNFNTTSLIIAVNLRKRMVPQLPDNCVGNMAWLSSVFNFNPFVDNKREIELHDLVCKMRQGLSEFCDVYVKKFGGKEKDLSFISECLKQITQPPPTGSDIMANQTLFTFTSWCRFPMYETDFGWGKPIWVTTCGCPLRNMIILMDHTRDGDGIEAIVNMEEKDMAKFERDVELLQYASLNPSSTVGVGRDNDVLSSQVLSIPC